MTDELTLDNTDPLDGGDYQCTVTNIAGSTTAMTTLDGKMIYNRNTIQLISYHQCSYLVVSQFSQYAL